MDDQFASQLATALAKPETPDSLIALAQVMEAAFPPVEPRPEFISELKGELRAQARQVRAKLALAEAHQHRLIWLAAGLGGLVYFMGMIVVGFKLTWSLLSFIAGLLGWKMTRSITTKPRVMSS